ncbi:MAG: GNAT family N-acetyltransferase [Patescibacteria group bacterium]|jgi:ribosomal protein S18 acetylase RimI-like enzyme
MKTRIIKLENHPQLITFWKENYFVSEMDSLDRFKIFLEKNPELSFITEDEGKIIGTVLGSFDGRRGYLQKLVVDKNYRGKGIGKNLIDLAVKKLQDLGALYIPVSCDSKNLPFYQKAGFKKKDQVTMSISK